MRKVTIAIMIILFLLALLVFYQYGVPHQLGNIGPTIKVLLPGANLTLSNYSYANYSRLLTDYGTLVTLMNNSFHDDLIFAYQRGLVIGVFAGLFIGFLFGAALEGVRKKNKFT